MEKTLTISVAAYNVEKYIEKLLDSIIAADVNEDIQVLVIDDGGKDRTAEITKEYEQKYPEMIKLVHKENGGHGSTINKGIELAVGKYFRALDGDDWVDSNTLNKLIGILKNNNTDMVINAFAKVYEYDRPTEIITMDQLEDNRIYQFDDIVDKIDWCVYHSTIYKTSVLKENGIKVSEHCFYEDAEYCMFPIPYINDVLYLKDALYCYRLGYDEQSVSETGLKKHIVDSEKVNITMLDYLEKNKDNVSAKKLQYLKHVTVRKLMRHYQALLLFKPAKDYKGKVREFDQWVYGISPELYEMMGEPQYSNICGTMRKTDYRFYSLILFSRKIVKKINKRY